MRLTLRDGGRTLLALQRAAHTTLHRTAGLVDLDLTAYEINALTNLADGQGHTVSPEGVICR